MALKPVHRKWDFVNQSCQLPISIAHNPKENQHKQVLYLKIWPSRDEKRSSNAHRGTHKPKITTQEALESEGRQKKVGKPLCSFPVVLSGCKKEKLLSKLMLCSEKYLREDIKK